MTNRPTRAVKAKPRPHPKRAAKDGGKRIVYSVADVAEMLDISIASVWKLLRGDNPPLKSYKVLHLRKIDKAAFDEYLESVRCGGQA